MYHSGAQLLAYMEANHMTRISQAALAKEMALTGKSALAIQKKMEAHFVVMQQSSLRGCDSALKTVGGMIGGDSCQMEHYRQNNGTICGDTVARAMTRALSCSAVNASMGRICAAPTAGACGILPAAIFTVAEDLHATQPEILDAIMTASGIGELMMENATVSGAEAGCQAECGTAAAMAAAAVVQLRGGDAKTALNAAGICLENVMGLICDPIAGVVEAPCAKRNASGAVNALLSADLALAGICSDVPFDEMVEAMYQVGRSLPVSLRETALGGIAATPTAQAIARRLFPDKSGIESFTPGPEVEQC